MNEQQQALSEWLQTLNWIDFLTVTFRTPRRDSIAALRDVGAWLTDPYFGFYERAFLTAEPHRWSRNLHIHAMGSDPSGEVSAIERSCRKRFGFSTVSVVKDSENACSYCSKYATKWSNGDNYDFFGRWG